MKNVTGAHFALVLHRKVQKKIIKIASSTCVSAVILRSFLSSTHVFKYVLEICFFLTVCSLHLTNTCPYLGYNALRLQHTHIQDADLMFLDVVSPLGALIGSPT